MSFHKLLDSLMRECGVSNSALGRACGVSDVSVGKWRKGESSPSFDNAISIAQYFRISLDELAEIKTYYGDQNKVRVPVIGSVSAYDVQTNLIYADEYIPVDRDMMDGYRPEECYAMRVRDDSLGPEYISEVSYMIFHQQKQCADNDIVIAHDINNRELMLKQFRWNSGNIELVMGDVQPIVYRKQDINRLQIDSVLIGKYVDA